MRCDDARKRLLDRLDDLLEAEAAAEVDAHVASCDACREARREAVALRGELYRPWEVAAPSPALAARVRRGSALPARRLGFALLRYAAVFAAGVLVARTHAAPAHDAAPSAEPPAVVAPAAPIVEPDYPRRIR